MGVRDEGADAAVRKALKLPDDVPVFVLVGTDADALPTIARYETFKRSRPRNEQPDEEWFSDLAKKQESFALYAHSNADKMGVPGVPA
jgi:hypothetical protein